MTGAEMAILNPTEMQAAVDYAERLAYSGLIPDVYQGKPANVLWAMEYGRTLNLTTIATITGVNVIKGKPTASAALISALVRRAGHKMRVGYDAATMTGWAEIVRCDDPDFIFRSEWDLNRAAEAELCTIKNGKPFAVDTKGNTLPWKKFYPSMVKARAITEVARDGAEEVLFGLHYTPEELGAAVDAEGMPVARVPEPQMQRERPAAPRTDEWSTAAVSAQSVEVVDAEIVGVDPDGGEQSTAAPAEPPKAGKALLRSLNIEARKHAASNEERFALIGSIIGRTISTTDGLSVDEATRALKELARRATQPPEGWTPEQSDQLAADFLAELQASTNDAARVEIASRIAKAVKARKISGDDRDTLLAAYNGASRHPAGASS